MSMATEWMKKEKIEREVKLMSWPLSERLNQLRFKCLLPVERQVLECVQPIGAKTEISVRIVVWVEGVCGLGDLSFFTRVRSGERQERQGRDMEMTWAGIKPGGLWQDKKKTYGWAPSYLVDMFTEHTPEGSVRPSSKRLLNIPTIDSPSPYSG